MAFPRTLIERLRNLKLIKLAWGLLIATVRNLAEEHRRMREDGWQTTADVTLSGKTLGLLGLGRIGKRMAEYAKVFGMEVIAWSQNLTDEAAVVIISV